MNTDSGKFQIGPVGIYAAYLSILGYGVTTETKARRHLISIGRALADCPSAEIQADLLAKRRTIQDSWGSLTPDGRLANDLLIVPAEGWLRTRTSKERTFGTLKIAATCLVNGETNLSIIHVWCFGVGYPRRLLVPVSPDTLRIWLKRTGIVHAGAERRVYGPGPEADRIARMSWDDIKVLLAG